MLLIRSILFKQRKDAVFRHLRPSIFSNHVPFCFTSSPHSTHSAMHYGTDFRHFPLKTTFEFPTTGNPIFPSQWRSFQCHSSHDSSEFVESSLTEQEKSVLHQSREKIDYDVVIVGAGPAGLSASIKLKQLNPDISVCVLEKGAEVGSHILSGNVFEPRALNELFTDWKKQNSPIRVPVTLDHFLFLTKKNYYFLPSPFTNKGNFVISLSEFTRWLSTKAEEMGVEIYSGFAGNEVLYDEEGRVKGIATKDFGIAKNGKPKQNFQRGIEINGKLNLFAEGCRGSLSEEIIHKFDLRKKCENQTYALGIKEVWRIKEDKHKMGNVIHTINYPLPSSTYGGGFMYYMDNLHVSLGFVVALDYENPYLNPYEEFQQWKKHRYFSSILKDGEVVEYGARTLNEGGFQSIPKLSFPGGALIGCAAGFLNVVKIKGTHTAMKSGMVAAEVAHSALLSGQERSFGMENFDSALKESWVYEELHKSRNIRPGFKFGLYPGLINSAFEHYISRGKSPWTLKHGKPDFIYMQLKDFHKPIHYPRHDGRVTFDILTSLHRSSTNHNHDQPSHLLIKENLNTDTDNSNSNSNLNLNYDFFDGPESRFCPAKVYEFLNNDGKITLQINAQNCLHCKACEIKDPSQNIKWTVPEGGGGPNYTIM